jgi:hypothetical protein
VLANPRIFGADLGDAVEGALGIVATAFIHDKVIAGFERPLVAGFKHANNSLGQAVSAVGTFLTAMLVGKAAQFVVSKPVADRLAHAGAIYAGAKLLSAGVPNLSVDAQYPDFFPTFSLFGQPAVGGANNAAQLATALPSATGLPDTFSTPAAVTSGAAYVGF